MKKIATAIVITLGLLMYVSSANAASADYDMTLKAIELNLKDVAGNHAIKMAQNDISSKLDEYFKQIQAANDEKMSKINEKSKTSPSEAAKEIEAWEKILADQRVRTDNISNKIVSINKDIAAGKITVDHEVLKALPKEELDEFKSMVPEHILKEKYMNVAELQEMDSTRVSLMEWCGDLLVPKAEAALAVGCVAACGGLTPACLACVSGALGSTASLTEALQAGYNKCSKIGWRWVRNGCKAAVIAAYVAAIA
jgi:hypothetical protein